MSKPGQSLRAPIARCTNIAVDGICMSGLIVATMIMSSCFGSIPAISSALLAAAIAMSLVASPSRAT
jgi:hypothetical protein